MRNQGTVNSYAQEATLEADLPAGTMTLRQGPPPPSPYPHARITGFTDRPRHLLCFPGGFAQYEPCTPRYI